VQAEACAAGFIFSLRIREYTPEDFETLRRLHAAQGFGYPLPDLESPMFVSKLVLEVDNEEGASVEKEQIEGREVGDRDSPLENSSCGAFSGARHSRIAMAVLLRLTAETYLLHDPAAGTPPQRWRNFLAMHDAVRQHAAARGLDDAQAFLPPRIARSFGRRLERLGWSRDPWPCFSRRV
jgi:hypothetical protein